MSLFNILNSIQGSGTPTDPWAGFTRLSALLGSLNPGDDLNVGVGSKLLIDTEMLDSNRLGKLTNSGTVRFKTDVNTRLLCTTVDNYGDFQIASAATPLDSSYKARIHLCGAIPTTSGNPGGGPLKRGLTHTNADTSWNFPANTSTGNNSTTNDNFGMSRAFMNNPGGILKLYGATGPSARRLNAHYSSGTTLVLDAPVTAKAGAKVLITPTGYFNSARRTEVRTLAADVTNSSTITISSALGYARWGVLQYLTDAGISTIPGTFSAMRGHAEQNPVIDQRAFVCIVDRNIQIEGYDAGNTSLASSGFGFHGMSMGLTSKTVLSNVQMNKYGQLGLLGRYGWHFHLPSYNVVTGAAATDGVARPGTGNSFVGGANSYADGDALINNCTWVDGFNRAMTWHGCVGVTVQDCVAYDSAGHSFFEEDGSEEGNSSIRNIAIAPRDPGNTYRLKLHDASPTGHWIANLNNNHKDCWGVDCPGLGWWNAPARGLSGVQVDAQHGCLGFSSNVPIVPFFGKMGTWDGMSAFCTGNEGGQSDNYPVDNAGNLGSGKIQTTTNGIAGAEYGNPNQIATVFKNARLFKTFGYQNRISFPTYQNWQVADNKGAHFHGATDTGSIEHPIGIRESLNSEGGALGSMQCNLMASYHGLLSLNDVSAYGFSGGTPTPGVNYSLLLKNAVIESWDLYTDPLHMWTKYMSGWKLYNSAGVYQTPSPALVNDTTIYDTYYGGHRSEDYNSTGVNGNGRWRWQLGILYDHFGSLTQGPSTAGTPKSFIVPNVSFYTTGLTTTAMPDNSDSRVTTQPFFGIFPFMDSTWDYYGIYSGYSPGCTFTRVDTSRNPISGAVLAMRDSYWNGNNGDGTPSIDADTGTTPIETRRAQYFWGNHHGVVPKDGLVKFVHTNQAAPNNKYFKADIYATDPAWNTNANAFDAFVMGISWANGVTPLSVKAGSDTYTSVGSFATLLGSGKGVYWRDTTNNMLWAKIGRPSGGYKGSAGGALIANTMFPFEVLT